jgi:hypothetical protein
MVLCVLPGGGRLKAFAIAPKGWQKVEKPTGRQA